MFENIKRQLKELSSTANFSVPISIDEKGYIDKQCPNVECEFLFKVNEVDWHNTSDSQDVSCPMCGFQAANKSWYTIDQVESAKREAVTVFQGQLNQALRKDAERFNRNKSSNGFLQLSMKVNGGAGRTYVLPIAATEPMQLEIVCDGCDARFSVVGSAYFCPICGVNSVERMFQDSLRKIRAKKDNADTVRDLLVASGNKDDGEILRRTLIETCLQDGVTGFQKYCEKLYEYKSGKPAKKNVFQRLNEGSALLFNETGVGYEDILNKIKMGQFTILFQKRHLLAHSDGIVDALYLQKSGDTNYKVGQRITVSGNDVDLLVELLTTLSIGVKAACKG